MKNNRIVALLLGVALMVGVVIAEDVPQQQLMLSNDTICAASAELVQTIYPVFDQVRTLQKKIVEGTTIREEDFLQLINSGFVKAPPPVLSTLSNETHGIIGLNLLRTVFDELLVAKKMLPSAVHDEAPIWLSEAFLKKAQQRFVDDICSGKIKFIESTDFLGADLLSKWLNLIDVQNSAAAQSHNVFLLLENFGAMLAGMVSLATISVNDVPGDRKMGITLGIRSGIEAMKLAAAWHVATSGMKFTKGEIDLLGTFLTKWLPEEMPKMIAASPLGLFKPENIEEVRLCVKYLFFLYSKIEILFLDAHFPGQGFAGSVVEGKFAE